MIEIRNSPYASSHHIEEIDVRFDDGSAKALLLKHLDRSPQAGPQFLYDVRRERLVYQRLLPLAPAGTAALHEAVERGLLLERVEGVQLSHARGFDAWLRAAKWIGAFHRTFANDAAAHASWLMAYDEAFYRVWLERANAFATRSLDRIAAGYEIAVDRLRALPQTVIHGEFYPSNIIVNDATRRVCPVDWELAAIGPGLMDLAALSTGWDDARQRALLDAYLSTAPAPIGDLDAALDCCRLHLAVRMLGWSRDWTPPSHHAFDWPAEASRLAARV